MSSMAGATETRTTASVAIDRDLGAAIWLALVLLSCALAVFLTCRRLAGALIEPPGGSVLVITSLGLASAAALLRCLAKSGISFLLPGISAVLLLAALTLPGTPTWGIAIAWLVLIVGEAMSWLVYLQPQRGGDRLALTSPRSAADVSDTIDEPDMPPGLVQRLTRIRENDRESLHALLQCEVAAQDQMAVVHLAFCPPLAARPKLTAHALDSGDVQVRITQVESFGARIEVRLPQVEPLPRKIVVEVLGSVTSPRVA